jgi:transcriptional regulator with XRE-family HTH domain
MKLSEKIYSLRKGRGLTQEQLAEELGISRQAVSKWESGAAAPEGEKLVLISKYFGVSVDYLVRDDISSPDKVPEGDAVKKRPVLSAILGLVLCILSFAWLIAWGIVMIADPAISEGVANSSMIIIDGRGILLAVFGAALALGIFLLLKAQKRR